jgi:hypothetical protein
MMDISPDRILRWLVIEVNPSVADSDKHVSFPCQYGVEDDLAAKEFFIELDTLINIRSKDMNVVNMTSHPRFLPRFGAPPDSKFYYKDNLKVNKVGKCHSNECPVDVSFDLIFGLFLFKIISVQTCVKSYYGQRNVPSPHPSPQRGRGMGEGGLTSKK